MKRILTRAGQTLVMLASAGILLVAAWGQTTQSAQPDGHCGNRSIQCTTP